MGANICKYIQSEMDPYASIADMNEFFYQNIYVFIYVSMIGK